MKAVIISDTHGRHSRLDFTNYKDCDTIIHCGDYTAGRKFWDIEFINFIEWFSSLPFRNKILISGNHDPYMEIKPHEGAFFMKEMGVIYLEDSSVEIDGVKIYGSPWTPVFFNWHFMKEEWDLGEIYQKIPEDTDILITHGPAFQILDRSLYGNKNVGSTALRYRIDQLDNLKYHLFGHIHEDAGVIEIEGKTFINAAIDTMSDFPTIEL